jgi:hypothetical protein
MFSAASDDFFDKKFGMEMIELNTRTWILSLYEMMPRTI